MASTPGMSAMQRRSVKHSQCRVNIFDGSVRAGKTFGWLWIIISECADYTGSGSIVIFGKNRDSIYRNVFEPIENVDVFAPFRPLHPLPAGCGHRHHLRQSSPRHRR